MIRIIEIRKKESQEQILLTIENILVKVFDRRSKSLSEGQKACL